MIDSTNPIPSAATMATDTQPPSTAPPRTVEALVAALQASRGVLRAELVPVVPRARPAGPGGPSAWQQSWRRWRRVGARWPVAAAVREAAQNWWRSHPWHDTGALLSEGLQQHALPVVRRHPWATLGAAAGVGALVVATRPWRWPLVGDQLLATPRRLGRWLTMQLTSAPVQAALVSMMWMAVKRQNNAPAADDPSDGAQPVADGAGPAAAS